MSGKLLCCLGNLPVFQFSGGQYTPPFSRRLHFQIQSYPIFILIGDPRCRAPQFETLAAARPDIFSRVWGVPLGRINVVWIEFCLWLIPFCIITK